MSHELAAMYSPGWYAAAGALGGAIVAGLGNQILARQQRRAELERLDRQLEHDRELRHIETQASADRLAQQLVHDRQLRDLEHLRATLAPIAVRAFAAPDLIVQLKDAISRAQTARDGGGRRAKVASLGNDLAELYARHYRDAAVVAGIVGLEAPVVSALRAVAESCLAASSKAREWLAGSCSYDDVDAILEGLDIDSGAALIGFVLGMNMTAGAAVL